MGRRISYAASYSNWQNSGLKQIPRHICQTCNFLDFSIWRILMAKSQETTHNAAKLPSTAAEWDWLAAVYIAKTGAHSAVASKLLLRKIKFKLQRCLANCPTHTDQYFSALL
jgi:hypothetical protein